MGAVSLGVWGADVAWSWGQGEGLVPKTSPWDQLAPAGNRGEGH